MTRELKEEMEIDVTINRTNYFMTISHQYPDFSITMSAYIVAASTDKFVMNDHISYVWLNREELSQLDWAPADIPIVEKLMRK